MSLSFLPQDVKNALSHLNMNFVTELRLRRGMPAVVEHKGKYSFLGFFGVTDNPKEGILCGDVTEILNAATGGSIYNYTEQMKNGFITVEHGVRIGIAGEYVTDGGKINAVKSVTSLNVRIPHDVAGCSDYIIKKLFNNSLHNTLIFSKPGLGKTTVLRDITKKLSVSPDKNVLVLDERNEIAAMDSYGDGFDLGFADVVRCGNKLYCLESALRAMKPDIIVTDELYGGDDIKAVKYAADCGICVIASSHLCDKNILKDMPFDYYVNLTQIGGVPKIYDKNFNTFCDSRLDDDARRVSFGG